MTGKVGADLANDHIERRLRVDRWEQLADDVVGLSLQDADGRRLPVWEPGAHIDLVLASGVVRQYSLCGDPDDRGSWRVAVLREHPGTGGSRLVHDQIRAGDVLGSNGPRNHFELVPAPRYIFIAGGIGITPILPMVGAVQAAGADWRLHYCGRTRARMAFADELVAAHGSHVTIYCDDEGDLLDLEALLSTPESDTLVYCCGPEGLLEATETRCTDWSSGALRVERFAARPLTEALPNRAFEVELAESGMTLIVPADTSLMDVLEEAGVAIMHSCREGTCGTCETVVLDGVVDHRDSLLTADERAANDVMFVCVSRAAGSRLVLDL